MRRTEFFHTRSVVVLGASLAASVALAGCGEERNQKPTVEISAANLEVTEGDEVTVDGAASSDPDGDPLRFYWELDAPEGSDVAFVDPRSESVSFVADTSGDYTVSLSVGDGEFRSETKSVTISAAAFVPAEGAPVASAGADQSVEIGDEVVLDGSDSVDPDGDTLTYAWTLNATPDGSSAQLSDPATVSPRFTADKAGEYRVGLKVSDETHTSREAQVTITAVEDNTNENLPPIANAGENQNGAVGTRIDLDASGSSDPDGDDEALSFFWSFDVKPPQSGAIAMNQPFSPNAWFVPDAEGTYVVNLEVRDADENLSTDTTTLIVERVPSDACLLISEYVQGTSYNKAVELYNCGDDELNLTNFRFCMFNNAETSGCTNDAAITRDNTSDPDGEDRLVAGDVLTLCEGRIESSLYDVANCDRSQGTYLSNLTGDDRFLIYEDTDANGTFTGVDLVVDAFGETRAQPATEIWEMTTYQRCNFDFFDGRSNFTALDYFNESHTNDFDNFGVAPTEGCD